MIKDIPIEVLAKQLQESAKDRYKQDPEAYNVEQALRHQGFLDCVIDLMKIHTSNIHNQPQTTTTK